MEVKLEESWKTRLEFEFTKPYFQDLINFVKQEYTEQTVYPKPSHIFRAFDECSFDDVKVVILGQDPYHGPGQANGLCFSVNPDVTIPPSLRNIYKEINSDIGKEIPETGDLSHWVEQGVFLLNATLTVRARTAGSHQKKGWEEFTDAAIKALAEERENLVFMLWGAYAQKKGDFIDEDRHMVLKSPHPSPFSADRGFFGSRPFSTANKYLIMTDQGEVDW